MREKPIGPRQQRREQQQAAEAGETAGQKLASAGAEPSPPPGAAEFAARLQVTETERAWIREHLWPFHENEFILDVAERVKAGKEATVYLCSAHPNTGRSLIAAKLYRERSLRSSQNVGAYQQGRDMLDEEGNAAKRTRRAGKAISQKTTRGQAAVHTSWLMHEFTLLQTLHAQGADVPEPIEHGGQALLMEFIGDEHGAAPTLNDVKLDAAEARRLFERVIFNIELLLAAGWVHGDLSAFNILHQPDRIFIIDFPQVVDCHNNPRAREIFERDIERVTQYFAGMGWSVEPRQLARELWAKHVAEPDEA
jgi:RIO kinase 1